MAVKPSDYPENDVARAEFEWRAYENYYSDQTLEQPYFYHHHEREGRFLDDLMSRFAIVPGSQLLDIGCGNGFYANLFKQRGLQVTGIDRSEKAINYCVEKYGTQSEWICDDAFNLMHHKKFDHAFCFWFMYFNIFDKPSNGADSGVRLMEYLKPGGKLFFIWHSDLTAVRLPPDRFSVMNYTIPQLKQFFPGFSMEAYAIDSPAQTCRLLGKYSFNKYITRLSCARVYMQASSWKRARLILVVHK